MRVMELDPHWYKVISPVLFQEDRPDNDVNIDNCDGIRFLCPKCWLNNGNSEIGTHGIICWKPSVDLAISPGPGRWNILGTGFHDLTLHAEQPSVHLTSEGGCHAHFLIVKGEIQFV